MPDEWKIRVRIWCWLIVWADKIFNFEKTKCSLFDVNFSLLWTVTSPADSMFDPIDIPDDNGEHWKLVHRKRKVPYQTNEHFVLTTKSF